MRARSGNVAADPDNLCGGVVFIAFRSLRGGVTGHATSGEVEFPPPLWSVLARGRLEFEVTVSIADACPAERLATHLPAANPHERLALREGVRKLPVADEELG